MAGKYTPLEKYLAGLLKSTREITFTFEKIEQILNDKLPPSAYRHLAWWANERDGKHVHAHAWMDSGWAVDSVNRNEKWVRFRRTE